MPIHFRIIRTSAAAIVLAVASPALADRFDDLWRDGNHLLEPVGITKPMFRLLTAWGEGQHLIGYCSAFLSQTDVTYWQNWWDKTVVPRSEVGRTLLAKGAEAYERGLTEAASKVPQKAVCQAALVEWSGEVTALNEEARVAASPRAQGEAEQ